MAAAVVLGVGAAVAAVGFELCVVLGWRLAARGAAVVLAPPPYSMTGWLAAALAEWPVSVQLVLEMVVVVGERLAWVLWLAACEIVVFLAGLAVLELVLHSEVAVAWPGLP